VDDLPGHHPSPPLQAVFAAVEPVAARYARHNGHADFLREAIDGVVGA